MKLDSSGGFEKVDPSSGDEAGRVEDEDEDMEAEYVIEMEDAITHQQLHHNQDGDLVHGINDVRLLGEREHLDK